VRSEGRLGRRTAGAKDGWSEDSWSEATAKATCRLPIILTTPPTLARRRFFDARIPYEEVTLENLFGIDVYSKYRESTWLGIPLIKRVGGEGEKAKQDKKDE